jgi:hypothetical protein
MEQGENTLLGTDDKVEESDELDKDKEKITKKIRTEYARSLRHH